MSNQIPHLFSTTTLHRELPKAIEHVRAAASALPEESLFSSELSTLAERVSAKYQLTVPEIELANARALPLQSVRLKDPFSGATQQGYRSTIIIPFRGSAMVFQSCPSTHTPLFPPGRVDGSELVIVHEATVIDETGYQRRLQAELKQIQQYLDWSQVDVQNFNRVLRQTALDLLQRRHTDAKSHRAALQVLGIPTIDTLGEKLAQDPGLDATDQHLSAPPYDVFICHASEDKDVLVRPLAAALEHLGLAVWFDEITLRVGDSLRQSIDAGLRESQFGVVVLSRAFFEKNWPQYELDGLLEKEMRGHKVILPIWCKVGHDEVAQYSPSLADKKALCYPPLSVEKIAIQLVNRIRT